MNSKDCSYHDLNNPTDINDLIHGNIKVDKISHLDFLIFCIGYKTSCNLKPLFIISNKMIGCMEDYDDDDDDEEDDDDDDDDDEGTKYLRLIAHNKESVDMLKI